MMALSRHSQSVAWTSCLEVLPQKRIASGEPLQQLATGSIVNVQTIAEHLYEFFQVVNLTQDEEDLDGVKREDNDVLQPGGARLWRSIDAQQVVVLLLDVREELGRSAHTDIDVYFCACWLSTVVSWAQDRDTHAKRKLQLRKAFCVPVRSALVVSH